MQEVNGLCCRIVPSKRQFAPILINLLIAGSVISYMYSNPMVAID